MGYLARAIWSDVHPKWTPLGPTTRSVIHHTASNEPVRGPDQPDGSWLLQVVKALRALEHGEMRRGDGLIGLAYHRLYLPDGTSIEGRPINAQGGATLGYNGTSRAYCFIGDFSSRKDKPTPAALEACAEDLAADTRAGWLRPGGHPTHGHRDLVATACPGGELYSWLPWLRGRVTQLLTVGKVAPMYNPPHQLEPVVADLACPTGGAWLLAASGAVYAYGGAPYFGGTNGRPWFAGRQAARLELPTVDEAAAGKRYVVIAGSGERYALPA